MKNFCFTAHLHIDANDPAEALMKIGKYFSNISRDRDPRCPDPVLTGERGAWTINPIADVEAVH